MVLISCGGGGGDGESQINSSHDLTGTWHGNITTNTGINLTVALTIIQTGNKISGTYNSSEGGFGATNGTVMNSYVNFTITQANPNCPGTFIVNGTIVNESTVTFEGSGTDCTGSYTGTGMIARV